MPNPEQIEHNFKYHAPDADKVKKHERIRYLFGQLAMTVDKEIPDCREKSLVMTKLEEGMLWANAGIARN